MSDHNQLALQTHILALSTSDNWTLARQEWVFSAATYHLTYTNCPCGVQIREMCYIHNIENNNETYIGNVCVNQFMSISVENALFDGIKRIQADIEANANPALIRYCYQIEVLKEHEYQFLMNVCLKRKFSDKQLQWKKVLNQKILNEVIIK